MERICLEGVEYDGEICETNGSFSMANSSGSEKDFARMDIIKGACIKRKVCFAFPENIFLEHKMTSLFT